MKQSWYDEIKNKMDEHFEVPPDGLWDSIEESLFPNEDKDAIIPIAENEEERKKRGFAWWRIAAVLLLLLSIGGGMLVYFNTSTETSGLNGKKDNEVYSKNNSKSIEIENHSSNQNSASNEKNVRTDFPQLEEANYVKNDNKANFPSNKDNNVVFEKQEKSSSSFLNSILKNESSSGSKNEIAHQNTTTTKSEIKSSISETQKSNSEIIKQEETLANTLSDEDQQRKAEIEKEIEKLKKKTLATNTGQWSAKVQYSGLSGNATDDFKGYYSMSRNRLYVEPVLFGLQSTLDAPVVNMIKSNEDKPVDTKIKHHYPVIVGALAQYQFNPKWGISTGVNYTKLTSDLKAGSPENFIHSQQSLHYIGIPVVMNYNFLNTGKFTAYLNAGGEADYLMNGTLKTDYVKGTTTNSDPDKKIKNQPLQFSAIGGVGGQYLLGKRLSVFAEPGVTYYFENKGQVGSVFKEKPLNFNVRVGLRLKID